MGDETDGTTAAAVGEGHDALSTPATIGVHARTEGADADTPGEGWWAVTDAGARVFVPASAVRGYRTLRNGQRVHLVLEAGPDAVPRVVRATPPFC